MGQFEGKVALVTGGTSGIGRATALAFAREGARVVVSGRRADLGAEVVREIEAAGGQARFVQCDVSDAAQVEALVSEAVEAYGRLDCAFNNAGTTGPLRPLHEYEESDFDVTIGVNLKGVWLCMKHEIRAMLAQDPARGAIVNTSSINGLGGVPRGSIYAASKAGVLALTKSAALEYGGQGIRVNALVAGAFDTAMFEGAVLETAGGDAEAAAAMKAQQLQFVPLGRIGHPGEAAAAVLWLCSDATSYVTGHSLIVDGGVTSPFR